jgi:hypothetical protein
MALANNLRRFVIAAALAVPIAVFPTAQAHAGIFISVNFAPPALPVYAQPVIPDDGYIWTPGYWAYGPEGYFWVPGVWVLPPEPGLLWTPPYWGFADGVYGFHEGYWGPTVGFYGGINYGFGYTGVGFAGGYWRGGAFFYNRAVGNFGGAHITNVYTQNVTVINHTTVAYNGGPGGIGARPTPEQMRSMNQPHVQPTTEQRSHQTFAAQNRSQLASVNHGNPAVRAAATPASFRANPTNPAAAARPVANERGGNLAQRTTGSERGAQVNERGAQVNERGGQVNERGGQLNERSGQLNERGGQLNSREAAPSYHGAAPVTRQAPSDRQAYGAAQQRQQAPRAQGPVSRPAANERSAARPQESRAPQEPRAPKEPAPSKNERR